MNDTVVPRLQNMRECEKNIMRMFKNGTVVPRLQNMCECEKNIMRIFYE